MTIKNVVLVGATGLVGKFILKGLKESPANFKITLLTRPDSKSKQPENHQVLYHNFDDPKLVDALRDNSIDAVVCALGTGATLSQIPLIDAAVKAGVQHFIPTEFASDTLNPTLPTLHPWYADKLKVHDHLVSTSSSNPSFKYTGIISGPFISFGITSGFLGYDIKSHTAKIYDGGELRVSYSEISQVGLAVARSLERGVTGYLHISTLTTTQNKILSSLERLSGEKWERKPTSTQEAYELSTKMMASHDEKERVDGGMLRAMRWVYGADCGVNWGEGDNAKLGIEAGELDDRVRVALRGEFE